MAANPLRIAVIGAGACGLSAIKACLEADLVPVCFERAENLGGLWNYTEGPETRRGCVMRGTITNISKELTGYSDFPIPKEFPNFLRHDKLLEYLHMYAEHFDLVKYIRFNSDVTVIKRADDYGESGRWVIHVATSSGDGNRADEGVQELIFDRVMVCSGYNNIKHDPPFKGQSSFQGTIMHAKDYRHPSSMAGKTVVVVGCGNTAGDVTPDIALEAKQVYMSTRRGGWVFSRIGPNGRPYDISMMTRYMRFLYNYLPKSLISSTLERSVNARFNHANYGMEPIHRIHEHLACVSDELPSRILDGRVLIKHDIAEVHPSSVEFTDGSRVDDVDVIVKATGYRLDFSFVEPGVMDMKKEGLYKMVFPPRLEKPTLAIIGCVIPVGPVFVVGELQARWAVQVFKGERTLPPNQVQLAAVHARRQAIAAAKPDHTELHPLIVPYVTVMDELAEMVGCKPNLWKLCITDPWLAWQIFFGPCTPTQYRLVGPHSWEGARQTIMDLEERILTPTKTRVI